MLTTKWYLVLIQFWCLILAEAAKECKVILDTVEAALPNGMPTEIGEDCKLQEMFHRALELLPELWKQAGYLDEAIYAYRRALIKPWNLESQRLAGIQKELATVLLYGGVEANLPPQLQVWGSGSPKTNIEEAILLLLIIMRKIAFDEIPRDPEVMDHLTFALSTSGQFENLANHIEQSLPGIYSRTERWYFLALCYSAAGQNDVALNLLRKVFFHSKRKHKTHLPSLLLGAKLCSQNSKHAFEGIDFAQRAIECSNCRRGHHSIGAAHHLLGVCYGRAAQLTVSDSERVLFQKKSLESLHQATMIEKDNLEVILSLGLENAVQRNLDEALENAKKYLHMMGGSSVRCWKLLALIISAEQCFKDAEDIVDIALDEMGKKDQIEFLRLKAILQVAQAQPKRAIESYRGLLSLVHAQRELQIGSSGYEVCAPLFLAIFFLLIFLQIIFVVFPNSLVDFPAFFLINRLIVRNFLKWKHGRIWHQYIQKLDHGRMQKFAWKKPGQLNFMLQGAGMQQVVRFSLPESMLTHPIQLANTHFGF